MCRFCAPLEPSGDETTIPLGTLAQEGTAEERETPLTKTEEIQKSDEHTSQIALTEAFLDVAEASIHETKAADIHQALENELLSLASPRQGTLHDYTNIPHRNEPQTEVPPTIQVETEEEEPAVGQSPFCFGPTDTAQYIATSILSGSIPDRAVALRDLVWRLIYEDKLALAFHTASIWISPILISSRFSRHGSCMHWRSAGRCAMPQGPWHISSSMISCNSTK